MGEVAKEPQRGRGWERRGIVPSANGSRAEWWSRGALLVLSELSDMDLPDGSGDVGPTWFVSVSFNGGRPKDRHVALVLRDFGMAGAEEDNHYPGRTRGFFLVVDPVHRVTCECKTTEETLVEPDGFGWTNPKPETGEGCRGCDFARMTGRPCPIHKTMGGRKDALKVTP